MDYHQWSSGWDMRSAVLDVTPVRMLRLSSHDFDFNSIPSIHEEKVQEYEQLYGEGNTLDESYIGKTIKKIAPTRYPKGNVDMSFFDGTYVLLSMARRLDNNHMGGGGKCFNCFTNRGSMFTCKKCMIARYCDKTCQVSNWRYHKIYCMEDLKVMAMIKRVDDNKYKGETDYAIVEESSLKGWIVVGEKDK